MKKLIINADDLGVTPGVTCGIIEAHLNGIVTSTSALMNSPHISESLASLRNEAPGLGAGVHLVLTRGKPLLPAEEVPSLVDDLGNFYKLNPFISHLSRLNLGEVLAEWRAQIEAFIAAGRRPDHLDSHHHSSYSSPGLFMAMLELAGEYNLPVRFPSKPEGDFPDFDSLEQALHQHSVQSPQACITSFYGEGVSMANLAEIISAIPDGVSELMCHPGYADRGFMEGSSYNTMREAELRILSSPEVKALLEKHRVSLANFSALKQPAS